MRQVGLIEVIAELYPGVRLRADQPLQLKRKIAQAGCEKWILTVAFHREAGQRLPLGTDKVELRIGRYRPLIEARQKNGRARGFSQTSHVAAVEFDRAPWTGERRLARGDLIAAQSNASTSPREGSRSSGYVSATVRSLKSESVGDFVAFRFVPLHQRHFIRLVGNGLSRAHAGPVKDAQIVKPAFPCQQLIPPHWRLRGNLRRLLDEREPRVFLSEISDFTDSH